MFSSGEKVHETLNRDYQKGSGARIPLSRIQRSRGAKEDTAGFSVTMRTKDLVLENHLGAPFRRNRRKVTCRCAKKNSCGAHSTFKSKP